MAEITNPQIVTFSNEAGRVVSDKLAAVLVACQTFQTGWAAKGLAAAINSDPAGPASLISDGSATDGRTRVSGNDLLNLSASINAIVTALNVTVVVGVGTPPSTQFNKFQVHGLPL